jgi:outer membrane protein assembly factor BamD
MKIYSQKLYTKNKKTFTLIGFILVTLLFSACSTKEPEYNKPAAFWYNKMIKSVKLFDLDSADDAYTSLQSEHRNSPLSAQAQLILAKAHTDQEEYELAKFYYDEYIKQNSNASTIDYIEYLKVKASFLGFKYQFREQQLLDDTLVLTQNFITKFPNSKYIYFVKDIETRIYMSKVAMNEEVAALYDRIDKPKASEYYRNKLAVDWLPKKSIEFAHVPFYRRIFE